jgi:hypothetical protein
MSGALPHRDSPRIGLPCAHGERRANAVGALRPIVKRRGARFWLSIKTSADVLPRARTSLDWAAGR